MNAPHGPYHRQGEPGGPGCQVTGMDIALRGAGDSPIPAVLLDAGDTAPEIELLRTVAHLLGVRWGHDEFGWWAAVPRSFELRNPE